MTCGTCGAGTGNGMTLCATCTGTLETDLREVDSMVEALWASAARMDVGTGTVGTSGHSAPMEPTNARAYDTGRTLNIILTGWTDTLGNRQPHAVKAATLLLTRIAEVRTKEWAPVLQEELHDALAACRKSMDRGGPRMFAGFCPAETDGTECGTAVYAPEGKPEARCPKCKAAWDVTEWRGRALAAAGPATGTAAEISRMLSDPITREALPQGTIRQWVNRGKLTPIGFRGERPVYQARKVRNLWDRSKAALAERRTRLAA